MPDDMGTRKRIHTKMMNQVTFCTDLFEKTRVGSKSTRSQKALGYYLWTLYQLDVDYLRENPKTTPLYETGVVYRAEPSSSTYPEQWRMIPEVYKEGHGDCEDLACWLAAEYTVQKGIQASPIWVRQTFGQEIVYHIKVRLKRSGKTLDPSVVLGMP